MSHESREAAAIAELNRKARRRLRRKGSLVVVIIPYADTGKARGWRDDVAVGIVRQGGVKLVFFASHGVRPHWLADTLRGLAARILRRALAGEDLRVLDQLRPKGV